MAESTPHPAAATALNAAAHHLRPGSLQLAALPPLSLYVHLPWCIKKCPYCDFNSHALAPAPAAAFADTIPISSTTQRVSAAPPQAAYLAALRADLEAALPLVWGRRVHSVFIGGGTPSLFTPAAIDELLGDLRARLPLDADAEITLEANPGTFERDRFRGYREAGVTRLSIGVQSFNDEHLQALGRVHDADQARAAVAEARDAFETFNIDLMYALPGQTLAQLDDDLSAALAFEPPHLSVYHLTLEPNTYFALHPPVLPDDDLASDMLDLIVECTAGAGLGRYEVSAFARAGHTCRHNLNYWQFGDYLGIGAGAHSKLSFPHRVIRQTRWREPAAYLAQAATQAVSSEQEVVRDQLAFEYMLNALRLKQGFAMNDFVERTGLGPGAVAAALDVAQAKGLIERDLARVWPSARGFDFLSDLQALFLPKT